MPIVFIAVQCCQCSTMQVKQQKKSGNKWTCVVCNQKQSVRKLYAQGYMAKDLRKFVQSFNMSRSFSDQRQHSPDLTETPPPVVDDPGSSERKRRTDWTEYLDLEEDHLRPQGDGDVLLEQRIVTEWPAEMFKKPRLRKNSSTVVVTGADGEDDARNLYRPVFTKRNTNRAVPMSKAGPSHCIGASTCSGLRPEMKASKWNDYITQEEDDLNGGNRSKFADHTDQGTMDDWETTMDDEKVEDDIHPDFK